MKKLIFVLCLFILLAQGCDINSINPTATPTPNITENLTTAQNTVNSNEQITPTPHAKISSDFENAPTAEQIKEETGKEISSILLQDTLTYTVPMDDYFAVCLEEDAEKAYRWLLVSENDLFEYIEETHINGYRVFVFKPLALGETSILFELSQDLTLVETLSYQIVFS